MPMTIKFDSANRPELPTFILMSKSGNRIGALNGISNVKTKDNLNTVSEFSFIVDKYFNGKKNPHWNGIKNFRIIYIPEWDRHFEIHVEVNEHNKCIKNVSGISLCEAELSQLLLFGMEVNTENDISRKDYSPTILYNKNNRKASLLNRLLSDSGQHYKILHVDDSIKDIQRTFTFDNKSIYDALREISEEIHCLFVFGEKDGSSSSFRTISAYDLESNCKTCNYRGEYTDICPECGSTDITEGYGKDTTIFVTNENLSEEIVYTTDIDSVKNCFHLEAGDDSMTAAVINASPAGSPYLWYFSTPMKEDMSKELVVKLNDYDKNYAYYLNAHESKLDTGVVSKYNQLISKYKVYNDALTSVANTVVGYQNLTKIYYDTIDFSGYLQNSLLPKIEMTGTNAKQQASLLTSSNLSPVSVENISYISLATANSTVLAYAKVYIDTSRYRVKVKNSSLNGLVWTGNFTVTSYSNVEDISESSQITVQFNNDYKNFIKQKIEKALSKDRTDDLSIVGLFKKNDSEFKSELKKYSLSHLNSFYDSCQSCLNILIEQGVSDRNTWNSSSVPSGNLYDSLYVPYLNKSNYISAEIKLRETEIGIVSGIYDNTGFLISDGLQTLVRKERDAISEILDFKKYIGDYWNELCTFRREDIWKNDNYISDGLSNAEMFDMAKQFLEDAKKDLIKSATLQHSISTTLKNLLIIDDFKLLTKYFAVGNWLRILIDDKVYKLRLISYEIDYDNLDNINVEFSDVTELGLLNDIESILNQSKSITTSYNSTKHQAEKGSSVKDTIDGWVQKGLDATLTKIVNSADNQDVVIDRHGILVRQYEEETDTYSPLQLKIVNGTMAMSDNGWETAKTGVGRFIYLDPKDGTYKTGYGIIANHLIGNIILSEEVGIYSKNGTMTFNENGLNIFNSHNSFTVNPNSDILLSISNETEAVFYVDKHGKLYIKGNGSGLDITSNDTTRQLSSRITQTAESITAEVNRAVDAEGKLSSSLKLTADSITAEVKRATTAEGNLSSSLKLTADSITAEVNRAVEAEGKLSSSLKLTADSIAAEVKRATTAEGNLSSSLKLTADSITSEVNRAKGKENELSSSISQHAEQIALKVTKGNVSSQLSVESGLIALKGKRLEIDTDKFKLATDGTTRIINGYLNVSNADRSVTINDGYVYFGDNKNNLDAGMIAFNPNNNSFCVGGYGAYNMQLGYWAGNNNFKKMIELRADGSGAPIRFNGGISIVGKDGITADISFMGEDGYKHWMHIWNGIITGVE